MVQIEQYYDVIIFTYPEVFINAVYFDKEKSFT